jgi:Tol biopolymer transport system component
VYISNKSGQQQPWMLPLAGGEPRRLSEVGIGGSRLWLSRDGRQVTFVAVGGTRICAFPDFNPCRLVKVAGGPLSGDGKTMFAVDLNDPRNILAQPIDGGTATPLTRFTDREITDFSLSPDGTRIAITRTTRILDVVLITGLK